MRTALGVLVIVVLLGCVTRHARPELIPCDPMRAGRKCPPGFVCRTSFNVMDDPNGEPSGSYCRPVEELVSPPPPPLECRSEFVDGGWVHEPLRDGGCFGIDE